MKRRQVDLKWQGEGFIVRLLVSYFLIPLVPPILLILRTPSLARMPVRDGLGIALIYSVFGVGAMLVLGTPLLVCYLWLDWNGFLPFMAAGGLCAGITSYVFLGGQRSLISVAFFMSMGIVSGLFFRMLLFGFHENDTVRLEELTTIRAPIAQCFDLARSVEAHLAGNVHCGEQALASAGVTSGLLGIGQQVTWRAKHFGIWQTLTSNITKMEPPVYFQDTMLNGPFRSMQHDHYFRSLPSGETEMRDVFYFAAPFPVVGRLAEFLFLRRYMRALLRERSMVLRQIAESEEWRKDL